MEAVSAATGRFAPARSQLRALLTDGGRGRAGARRARLPAPHRAGRARGRRTCRRCARPTRSPATAGCSASSRRSSTGCCGSGTSRGSSPGCAPPRGASRRRRQEEFEQRLLRELHVLEQRHRSAAARRAAAAGHRPARRGRDRPGDRRHGRQRGRARPRRLGRRAHPAGRRHDGAGERGRPGRRARGALPGRAGEARPARPEHGGPADTAGACGWRAREDVDAATRTCARCSPRSCRVAALPLLVAGSVVGALRLSWSVPHVFSDTERDFLDGLAVQTAQAVARADALQRLRDLRDELDRLLRLRRPDPQHRPRRPAQPVRRRPGRHRRVRRRRPLPARQRAGGGRQRAARRRPRRPHACDAGAPPATPPEDVARLDALLERVLRAGRAGGGGARPARRRAAAPAPGGPPGSRSGRAGPGRGRRRARRRHHRRSAGPSSAPARSPCSATGSSSDRTVDGVLDARRRGRRPRPRRLGRGAPARRPDDRVTCPLVRHPDPALRALLADTFGRLPVQVGPALGAGRRAGDAAAPSSCDPVAALGRLGVADKQMARGRARGGQSAPARSSRSTRGAGARRAVGGAPAATGLSAEDLAVVEDVGRRAGAALEGVQARATTTRLEIALDAADVGSFDWDVRTGALTWDDADVPAVRRRPGHRADAGPVRRARSTPTTSSASWPCWSSTVAAVGELDLLYRRAHRRTAPSAGWRPAGGRCPGPTAPPSGSSARRSTSPTASESSARAERTLELMGDAFFSLDRSWRFTYVNREAERLLGRGREELLGRDVWECFPEAVGSPFEEQYRRAVATGEPARFEQWFAPLGRHFEVRAHPGPEGLSVYFSDVTGRRQTALQRDRALRAARPAQRGRGRADGDARRRRGAVAARRAARARAGRPGHGRPARQRRRARTPRGRDGRVRPGQGAGDGSAPRSCCRAGATRARRCTRCCTARRWSTWS